MLTILDKNTMNDNKDYGSLCKNHSARSEKEFCRVCPSKLNKKELEDVYFSLLENNLVLKRTINNQDDKIKMLSTKIQRLSAVQKTYLGKEPNECCGRKAVINEQKERISELQRSNQCLSEKIRQLNMRLCSAKQFLKRSPFQSLNRCNRCSNKNTSLSALNTKTSYSNLRTAMASSQYLDKDVATSRTADNQIISLEKAVQYDFCDENKCRSRIEELETKNEELQQQISKIKEDHARRITHYESQVAATLFERAQAEARSSQLKEESSELSKRLATAEIRCDELSAQLVAEQRRAGGLRGQLHEAGARLAALAPRTVSNHADTRSLVVTDSMNIQSKQNDTGIDKTAAEDQSPRLLVPTPSYQPKAAVRTKIPQQRVEDIFKNSDDSGYTEVNRSHDAEDNKFQMHTSVNQLLLEKIADLQNQINSLRISKDTHGVLGCSVLENSTPVPEATQDMISKRAQNDKVSANDQQNGLDPEVEVTRQSSQPVNEDRTLNSNNIEKEIPQDQKNDTRKLAKIDSQTVNKLSSSGEISSDNKTSFKETQGNKIDMKKSQCDDTKRKESFKEFKKRSRDKIKSKRLIDSRKYSLESSREAVLERNLFKTSSLDENRIIDAESTKDFDRDDKKSEATDKILKQRYSNQTDGPKNNFTINDKECKTVINERNQNPVEDSKNVKEDGSKTSILNIHEKEQTNEPANTTIKPITNNSFTKNSASNNKDSDSSKGTYSIHKEDIVTGADGGVINKSSEEYRYKDNNLQEIRSRNIITDRVKKNVLNRVISKDKLISETRRSSTQSLNGTYVINNEKKPKSSHELSPDSTEYEISSLSDLSSESNGRNRKYQSPGEQEPSQSPSESPPDATTDYGSLSEGELPLVGGSTTLSAGETRPPNRTVKSHSLPVSTSQQMEEALTAVKTELARCTSLLKVHTRRSLDGTRRLNDSLHM